MRAALLAPLLISLWGCKLVDQRTFNPHAGTPPVAPKPPVPAAQPDRALAGLAPLVTIRLGQDTGYDQAVARATSAVLARKRDAQFTVLTAVPPGPAEARTVADAVPTAAHAASIIERRGVLPGRVRLEARAEPNLATSELRIYVQ
ncbi:MAG: hypothetical protein JO157_12255 [Acetobacteraceae bacterium]|nr:hypothetical protein [Acetobacteraceae bacterium]